MADFFGGVVKGFGPAYDTASARRIRAEERAEDRKYADDIRDKQWKRQVEERMKLWRREDAQLRIQREQALQDRADALAAGNAAKAQEAEAIIQSLDREIREKVQPQPPPLLGGPAMGKPGALSIANQEWPEQDGYPHPFEGSPDMMESIRQALSEEKGEVSDAAILGAAVKGQRMQTLAEDLKKEDQKHEIKGKRAFEYLKDIKTADSPPHNFLSKFDAGREWIDAVMNMELEEGGRKPRISVPTAIQFADMIKASVSEFSKTPTKAKPKAPIGDVVDEIIQMQGQLGDRVPTQTREALAIMGQGPLRRLHGGLTDRLAVRKREREIEDYKEKGTGLTGSTRGYKAAAEAGVKYSELEEQISAQIKEGEEPDPKLLREMKSSMAHVMAFYSYPGRLVPSHLEDLVRGAGRIPNNTILTDMALSHEMSMYAQSLGKDVSHLIKEYGKKNLTKFIGPIQAPLSELVTTFGIDANHPDRFIVNRLRQKYGDMANYKLFLQSGKAVTEQEYNRLKAVVGNPEREDFLDKLLGYAHLEKERTQRKFKAYTDAGLRFNPDLEKGILGGVATQGQEGLSSAEEAQLKKYRDAKAAGLLGEEDELKYRELLLKILRK